MTLVPMILILIAPGEALSLEIPRFDAYEESPEPPVAVVRSALLHAANREGAMQFALGRFRDPDPFGADADLDSVWSASVDSIAVRPESTRELRPSEEKVFEGLGAVAGPATFILESTGVLLAVLVPEQEPTLSADEQAWFSEVRSPEASLPAAKRGQPVASTQRTALEVLGLFWAYTGITLGDATHIVARPRTKEPFGAYWVVQGFDATKRRAMVYGFADEFEDERIYTRGAFLYLSEAQRGGGIELDGPSPCGEAAGR